MKMKGKKKKKKMKGYKMEPLNKYVLLSCQQWSAKRIILLGIVNL